MTADPTEALWSANELMGLASWIALREFFSGDVGGGIQLIGSRPPESPTIANLVDGRYSEILRSLAWDRPEAARSARFWSCALHAVVMDLLSIRALISGEEWCSVIDSAVLSVKLACLVIRSSVGAQDEASVREELRDLKSWIESIDAVVSTEVRSIRQELNSDPARLIAARSDPRLVAFHVLESKCFLLRSLG